jgi:large subunit ribosomal protein L18
MRIPRSRRRDASTNYAKRIAMLKSGVPRVVVRRSNRQILAQLIDYKENGDIVLASACSKELKKLGWEPRSNIPTAYLTGMLLAKKAKKLATKGCILDIGLARPVSGSVSFAAAKGSQDGGLALRFNAEVDAGRITGAHIAKYAAKKPAGPQFALYAKSGFDAARISETFESVKKKILSD